jgi:hypothetical protein
MTATTSPAPEARNELAQAGGLVGVRRTLSPVGVDTFSIPLVFIRSDAGAPPRRREGNARMFVLPMLHQAIRASNHLPPFFPKENPPSSHQQGHPPILQEIKRADETSATRPCEIDTRAAALFAAHSVCLRSHSLDRTCACEICCCDMRLSNAALSSRLRASLTAAPNKNHSSAKIGSGTQPIPRSYIRPSLYRISRISPGVKLRVRESSVALSTSWPPFRAITSHVYPATRSATAPSPPEESASPSRRCATESPFVAAVSYDTRRCRSASNPVTSSACGGCVVADTCCPVERALCAELEDLRYKIVPATTTITPNMMAKMTAGGSAHAELRSSDACVQCRPTSLAGCSGAASGCSSLASGWRTPSLSPVSCSGGAAAAYWGGDESVFPPGKGRSKSDDESLWTRSGIGPYG